MNILAIDCGNTRIKFACADAGNGIPEIRPEYADRAFPDGIWEAVRERCGEPARIVISNVAGAAVGEALAKSLRAFAATPVWVRAAPRQCGVSNLYDDPAQLGSDRWAALIGAWGRAQNACLVVNAGTATTVDALSSGGEFLGGLIVPGFALMLESLATGTAGLPRARGATAVFPRNTADAIWNGCLAAQVGAIEQLRRELPASATCWLSGGAAQTIYPALNMPCMPVDNLVLEGLLRIAAAQPG